MRAPDKLRLLAWTVLVVGALATGFYWWRLQISHDQLRHDTLQQGSGRAMQLADAQANEIETLLRSIDLTLRQFRDATQSRDQDAALRGALTALRTFPARALDHYSVVDAHGYIVQSTNPLAQRVYVGDREFFKFHRDSLSDRLYINKPVFGRTTKTWVVLLTRPLYRGGQFAGVVAVALNTQYLADTLARLAVGSQDSLTLFYDDGAYLARSHKHMEVMGKALPNDRPFLAPGAANAGSFRVRAFADQVPRLYGWNKLDGYPLIVTVGLDETTLLAPAEQEIGRARVRNAQGTALILGLCLLLLGLLWAAARQRNFVAPDTGLHRRRHFGGGRLGQDTGLQFSLSHPVADPAGGYRSRVGRSPAGIRAAAIAGAAAIRGLGQGTVWPRWRAPGRGGLQGWTIL